MGEQETPQVAYSSAAAFERLGESFLNTITARPLRVVATDLIANINRVYELSRAPADLFRWAQASVRTRVEETMSHGIAPTSFDAIQRDQLLRSTLSKTELFPPEDHAAETTTAHNRARLKVEAAVHNNPDTFRRGIVALLESCMIGANTIWESLATDLWLALVRRCPVPLVDNILSDGRTKEDDADPEPETKLQEKSIPMSWLSKNGYNVKRHMGEILRDRGKVSFLKWPDVRQAYLSAFKVQTAKAMRPNPELVGIFDKYKDDIHVLQQIRNLIAHRGGKVDRQFEDSVKGRIACPPRGHIFPVDGEMACKYTSAAIQFSKELLTFGNGWFENRTKVNKDGRKRDSQHAGTGDPVRKMPR